MASLVQHLPLVLVVSLSFTILFHTQNPVKADDDLIKQACNNADAPALCIQCVKSDPKALEADQVGIATIVVKCLSKHATALASNMSDMASHVKEKELESVFQNCSKGYTAANKDLSVVISRLKKGDYDGANYALAAAITFHTTCYDEFEKYVVNLPAEVLYEMRVYEELTESGLRIIDRLQ